MIESKFLGWRDNEIYSHGHILREYTGVNRQIVGHVQHGWNYGSGWTIANQEIIGRRSLRIVWGNRQLSYSRKVGIRVLGAIGAPWLYLNEMKAAEPQKRSVIFVPSHGTRDHEIQGAFDRSLKAAAEFAAGRHLAVLLSRAYEPEYLRRVEICRASGIEVLASGDPKSRNFLSDLRQELSGHEAYITDRLSTSTIYAGSMGLELNFLNEGTKLAVENVFPKQLLELQSELAQASRIDRISIASRELGQEFMRGPSELAEIIGQRGVNRLFYPAILSLSLANRIRRRAISFVSK